MLKSGPESFKSSTEYCSKRFFRDKLSDNANPLGNHGV